MNNLPILTHTTLVLSAILHLGELTKLLGSSVDFRVGAVSILFITSPLAVLFARIYGSRLVTVLATFVWTAAMILPVFYETAIETCYGCLLPLASSGILWPLFTANGKRLPALVPGVVLGTLLYTLVLPELRIPVETRIQYLVLAAVISTAVSLPGIKEDMQIVSRRIPFTLIKKLIKLTRYWLFGTFLTGFNLAMHIPNLDTNTWSGILFGCGFAFGLLLSVVMSTTYRTAMLLFPLLCTADIFLDGVHWSSIWCIIYGGVLGFWCLARETVWPPQRRLIAVGIANVVFGIGCLFSLSISTQVEDRFILNLISIGIGLITLLVTFRTNHKKNERSNRRLHRSTCDSSIPSPQIGIQHFNPSMAI
jgi:hypothetical protein